MGTITQLSPTTANGSPQGTHPDEEIRRLVRGDYVHRTLYTDPSVFDKEMVRVFGGTWTYVAHESQIPKPDDFVTTQLGIRPVIVTRDSRGQIHVLLNRCTHRGSTVCRESSGSAKRFQCPYHAWMFANDGRLDSVPWPKGYGSAFSFDAHRLGSVPRVECYRQFIFATFNMELPPLAQHLGPATEYLDAWLDRYPTGNVIVRSSAQKMMYRANWKLSYDNAADGYHPAFSHRSLLRVAARYGEERDMQYFARRPDEGPLYVKYLGNGHTVLDQRPGMRDGYWKWIRPFPGMEAFEASLRERYGDAEAERFLNMGPGAGLNLNIFPNLLIIGNHLQIVEPLSVDSTALSWYGTTIEGVPSEINTLRMRMQEDFPAFGEPDDLANFEEAQRGMLIPEMEWIDVSRGAGTGRETTDDRGVVTGPVTDEHHVRGYFQEWTRLMTGSTTGWSESRGTADEH
jgi:phenylpropionate dioxygenase-like ring-hydroxylating dioxygenase large terminal subunit